MSNLTPDDIERMNAAWDAIDAGLAKGDPRFAEYMATRTHLTPQITRRSGTMDDDQFERLEHAIYHLGAVLEEGLKRVIGSLEGLDGSLGDLNETLDALDETLAEKLELQGDATRDQAEATRVGFDLLRQEVRNVGGEINALRTSDR